MYTDFTLSKSRSTDQMLKNIANTIDQAPASISSISSTEKILRNIKNTPELLTSPNYTSSPSDVGLWDKDIKQKMPPQHLQQYQQMINDINFFESSSDDMEYRPPSLPVNDVAVLAGHAELSLNPSTYRTTLLAK
jgi:hypothetical protein